jgi:pimeloyl-ACP methyl ester carboxylesterase
MRRVVRWGLPLLVVLLVVAYLGVSYLIASQVAESEHKEQEELPGEYGLVYEDVEFMSRADGLALSGWYIQADSEGPTLLFVHGIGGVRSGDNAVELASMLVERGFDVLMFDLRGHGSSEGDRVSGGDHERQDVLGALDFLEGRGVALENVGVLGFSMGAGTAALAMAEAPEVRALVLDSPYANASDRIAHEIGVRSVFPAWIAPVFVPGAKVVARLQFDIDIGALVPERVVADLDYPLLIIHGEADTRIPVEHGIRVHMASHTDSELWLVEGVDHVDAFLTYPEEYTDRVAAYFEERLGGE